MCFGLKMGWPVLANSLWKGLAILSECSSCHDWDDPCASMIACGSRVAYLMKAMYSFSIFWYCCSSFGVSCSLSLSFLRSVAGSWWNSGKLSVMWMVEVQSAGLLLFVVSRTQFLRISRISLMPPCGVATAMMRS